MPAIGAPGSKHKIRGMKQGSAKITSRGPVDLLDDGSATQQVTYECFWTDLFKFMPVRQFTPSPDFPQLLCASVHAEYKQPGLAVMVVTYRGLPGLQLPPGSEECVVSTQEQPIETHPLFSTLIAGRPDATGKGMNGALFLKVTTDTGFYWKFDGWDPGDAAANTQPSPYLGTESYLAPTMTFRNTYASFNRPDITRVGQIGAPDNAPEPGGKRNWLMTGVTWRRYGGYYSINEEALRSGANGWDGVVYGSGLG